MRWRILDNLGIKYEFLNIIMTKSGQIDLLKMSDLKQYTGYIRGCSPLGMIKKISHVY